MDEALRRAAAMREAGADVLYVLQREPAQAREVGQALDCPLFYAMSGGVPSIGMELDELGELGFRIINDAVTPFLAAQKAMRDSYRAIKEWKADPTLGEHGYSEGTQRIHTVIDLARLLEIERRTVEK